MANYETVLSVIVCSVDPAKQHAIRAQYERAIAGLHEFILIDNARSLAEGYNRGFKQSSGDIVIFSHDDIEIRSDDFHKLLLDSLVRCDLVGVAGTSRLAGASWATAGRPYLHGRVLQPGAIQHYGPPSDKIEALDGVFLAARQNVCRQIPFDEATFDGFHFYDLDFSHRAFLAGFKVGICEFDLWHHSDGSYDEHWQRYADRFVTKHRKTLRPSLLAAFHWQGWSSDITIPPPRQLQNDDH